MSKHQFKRTKDNQKISYIGISARDSFYVDLGTKVKSQLWPDLPRVKGLGFLLFSETLIFYIQDFEFFPCLFTLWLKFCLRWKIAEYLIFNLGAKKTENSPKTNRSYF